MKKLLLFDIDGTLLLCGPQVRPIFLGAMTEIFGGHSEVDGFSYAGKTDQLIARELARPLGLGDEEIAARLEDFIALYCERLEADLKREKMKLLPGVRELLERVTKRSDVVVGLLTGNWSGGARIKLSRFELGGYFPFGAFGDDAIDRRDLLPVAIDRAEVASGKRFEPEEVLLIGDSLLDVDCARAGGAEVLAVATGFTPADKLRAAGAHWVYDDLVTASRDFELFAG